MLVDLLLMLRDRLPPFGVVPDHIRIGTQLQSCEPQNFAVDLQRLLLRKAPEHTNEGDLVGEAQPVVGSPALRNLAPVVLEEAAVADEAGPGDVAVGDRHDL